LEWEIIRCNAGKGKRKTSLLLPISANQALKISELCQVEMPRHYNCMLLRGNMDSIVKQSLLVRKTIDKYEYDNETSHPTARFAISIE
jgi:5,10-methylenetetrahydrofolate reductase